MRLVSTTLICAQTSEVLSASADDNNIGKGKQCLSNAMKTILNSGTSGDTTPHFKYHSHIEYLSDQ